MPITITEFTEHLGNVAFPLAVAVSGGADSLALLLLAHEVAQKKGSYVIALTVDHNLRPESKEEALQVKKWAEAQGIQHNVLEWTHDHPTSRLQERARQARYGLLIKWCKDHQISTVLLGHHQQDQEETFWLRLSSGSGLNGLGGMKNRVVRDGILFLRPLLEVPKGRIKETLRSQNQEWIEDPSNQNPHYFRVRVRQFLQAEGLTTARLMQVMKKLQVDGDFIQGALEKAIQTTVQSHNGGYLTLDKKSFTALHPAIANRLLSSLVKWFSNSDYAPRSTQVMTIANKIKMGCSFTTGGIYWTFSRNKIFLFREKRAIKQEISLSNLQETTLWDQRFWIDSRLKDCVSQKIIIGPLSEVSSTLRKEVNSLIPAYAWPSLPALWEKGKLVAVPHLCYNSLRYGEDLKTYINLKPLFHDSLRFTI